MSSRITYANVMATVAVFLALGGGALATGTLIGSDGRIHGCVAKNGSLKVLKRGKHCGRHQTKTQTERNIHGNQAFQAGLAGALSDAGIFSSALEAVVCSSSGFQNFINTARAVIETAALTVSTSHGP